MENPIGMLRKAGDWALGRGLPPPEERKAEPEPAAAGPVARPIEAESFSLQQVERFFAMPSAPQGNALTSEILDENGPLPGRDQTRGRRRTGGLAMEFGDDTTRPVLFAPNDAPDALQQEPTELQALLRDQEGRVRRRFTA